MADKVKRKVIPRKATTFKQMKSTLKNDEWAVYSTDEIILSKIYDQLSKEGEASSVEGTITYKRRRVPVLLVPFYIVDFLKNNRHSHQNYVSFHRKRRSTVGNETPYGLWMAWKEGKTTPNTFLSEVFKNWKRV